MVLFEAFWSNLKGFVVSQGAMINRVSHWRFLCPPFVFELMIDIKQAWFPFTFCHQTGLQNPPLQTTNIRDPAQPGRKLTVGLCLPHEPPHSVLSHKDKPLKNLFKVSTNLNKFFSSNAWSILYRYQSCKSYKPTSIFTNSNHLKGLDFNFTSAPTNNNLAANRQKKHVWRHPQYVLVSAYTLKLGHVGSSNVDDAKAIGTWGKGWKTQRVVK